MKMRNVPVLLSYYERFNTVPQYMAVGFAAWLLFTRSVEHEKNDYLETHGRAGYHIQDDLSAQLHKFQTVGTQQYVQQVLGDKVLWDTDLKLLPEFTSAVTWYVGIIQQEGARAAMKKLFTKK